MRGKRETDRAVALSLLEEAMAGVPSAVVLRDGIRALEKSVGSPVTNLLAV